MLKAYKFRLYPTQEQGQMIQKTFGCARFVYNELLQINQHLYRTTGRGRIISPAKLKVDYPWLTEVDSSALLQSYMHLQSAFQGAFKSLKGERKGKRLGFPKMKSKKTARKVYSSPVINNNIRIQDGKLRLPKVGLVKVRFHSWVEGTIKNVTVSQNPNGKYYVSILTEQKPKITNYMIEGEEKIVGIDMSFKECGVLSDEKRTNFQRFYRNSEKKLGKAQRRLSRKQKGSENRNKERLKVATMHEKIANQRKDFQHKLSHYVATNYDVCVVEDINLTSRSALRGHGKSVADIGFGELRNQIEYKMNQRLKTFVKAPKFFASTQLCSSCGYQNKNLRGLANLGIREWTCPSCNSLQYRVINAANNLVSWYKTNTAATAGI
jgi:putative transposase